jgi:hypothetical protein
MMSKILNRDYSAYHKNVKIELAILFSNYESKFCGVRLQRPPQPNHGGGKKVCSWNRLFGTGQPIAPFQSPTPAPASASTSALPVGSKLTTYLDSDHVSQFHNSFSILS